MKKILVLLICTLLTSCGVYNLSTTPKLKITKVLTITSTGDTIAVPIKDFQKYNYENIRFNTWNSYPLWNSWGYPYYNYGWNFGFRNSPRFWNFSDWYYRPPTWNLSTPIRPQIQSPSIQRVKVKGRRGSINSNIKVDNIINNLRNNNIDVEVIERRNDIRLPRNNNNNWNNRIIPRENNNFTPPPNNINKPVTRPSIPRGEKGRIKQ